MTALRYGATAVLAGLTAAYEYYPHQPWIPIAIAVLGTLGIHVVPSALTPKPPAAAPEPGTKAP
jgi:hypothetical protein